MRTRRKVNDALALGLLMLAALLAGIAAADVAEETRIEPIVEHPVRGTP